METNRQLKIGLLKDQSDYSRTIQCILSGLLQTDPNASLLPVDEAIASRTLVKKLWDALPEEQDSYQFNSIDEQTNNATVYLPTNDFTQSVTLHLGWDILSFTCSLEAAWFDWKNFNNLNTDTFNCCIYPRNLEWYIIRAGNNLYPMFYSGDKFVLTNNKSNV